MKPIGQFYAGGKVVVEEFLSVDCRILSGYRAVPEERGFRAWERSWSFDQPTPPPRIFWFATAEEARSWAEKRAEQGAPVVNPTALVPASRSLPQGDVSGVGGEG